MACHKPNQRRYIFRKFDAAQGKVGRISAILFFYTQFPEKLLFQPGIYPGEAAGGVLNRDGQHPRPLRSGKGPNTFELNTKWTHTGNGYLNYVFYGREVGFVYIAEEFQCDVNVFDFHPLDTPFHRRPNEVVATTSATKITAKSVGASTTTFTVNTDLTGSLSAGSLIDFINGQPPFLLWAEDVAISSITATSIVVSNDDIENEASEVEIGTNDYICAA